MRLQSLHIENFGVYHARHFAFAEGLQVIYGPNEAGKSTLLHALRNVLFGFPVRSPYKFASHQQQIAAVAHLSLRDGRTGRVRRQKGQPDQVTGEFDLPRQIIDEQTLTHVLQGANGQLFENIFAFSLAELAEGEHSLREANLQDALFGGALGGLNRFQEARTLVVEEANKLFAPRARTKLIHTILNELQQAQQAHRGLRIRGPEYELFIADLDDQERRITELSTQRDDLYRRSLRLERLINAHPIQQRIKCLEAELAVSGSHPVIARGQREQANRLISKRAELVGEILELDRELKTSEVSQTSEALQISLFDNEAAIRALIEDLGRYRSAGGDASGSDEIVEQRIRARMPALHQGWTIDDLTRLVPTLVRREAAERLAEEELRLSQALATTSAKRADVEKRLDKVNRQLQSLPDTSRLVALQDLLQRSDAYRVQRSQLADLLAQLVNATRTVERKRSQLCETLQVVPDVLGAIHAPLPATVAEYVERHSTLRSQAHDISRRESAANEELSRSRNELATFDAQVSLSSRNLLLASRARRDAGWALIQRKYVGSGQLSVVSDQPEGSEKRPAISDQPEGKGKLAQQLAAEITAWTQGHPDDLIEQFNELVVSTDLMADRLLVEAEQTARRDQLVLTVERAENRLSDIGEEAHANERAAAELDSSWHSVWTSSNVSPLSPAEMADWLVMFQIWREASDNLTAQQAEADTLDKSRLAFEKELLRAFPQQTGTVDQALAQATDQLQSWKLAVAERERLQREETELRADLEAVEKSDYEQQIATATFRNARKKLAEELGLPSSSDAALVAKVLAELSDLSTQYRDWSSRRERVRAETEFRTAFAARVIDLCRTLAPDLQDGPADVSVAALGTRLEAARQNQLESARRLSSKSAAEQRLVRCREQLFHTEHELAETLKALGLSSSEQLQDLDNSLRLREDQTRDLQASRRELAVTIGEGLSVEGLEGAGLSVKGLDLGERGDSTLNSQPLAPGTASIDDLKLDLQHVRDDLLIVEAKYRSALESRGAKQKQVDDMQNDARVRDAAATISHQQAKLTGAVNRWAPLMLTQELMKRALENFEKNHQPQLLKDIADLFARFTNGEYVDVRRKLGDKESLHVISRRGEVKTPAQLSTGSREQLYLAIRLAYVRDYCRRAEPLPIVMDDVLVNFDEDRAARALDVLVEVGQECQILFLTCHKRLVRLLQQLQPALKPLELIPGSLARDDDALPGATLRVDDKSAPPPQTPPPQRTRIPAAVSAGVIKAGIATASRDILHAVQIETTEHGPGWVPQERALTRQCLGPKRSLDHHATRKH